MKVDLTYNTGRAGFSFCLLWDVRWGSVCKQRWTAGRGIYEEILERQADEARQRSEAVVPSKTVLTRAPPANCRVM